MSKSYETNILLLLKSVARIPLICPKLTHTSKEMDVTYKQNKTNLTSINFNTLDIGFLNLYDVLYTWG